MKTKIFVCTFEDKVFCNNDIFVPIQVGKKNTNLDLGYLSDNVGDNKADKNPWYSEQTALYWVWKNIKGLDCVGFMQYRKLLQLNKKKSIKTEIHIPKEEFNIQPNIDMLMHGCDIILANPLKYSNSLAEKYEECHIPKDLEILDETVKNRFPEYYDAFKQTMYSKPGILHPYNIFIMRWKWFDEYCKFIFPLFEILEKKLDLKNHIGYQKRVFGYMAERLLNVFCLKHKLLVRTRTAALITDYYTKDKEEKQTKAILESLSGKKIIQGEDPKTVALQDSIDNMSDDSKKTVETAADAPVRKDEMKNDSIPADVPKKRPKSILFNY